MSDTLRTPDPGEPQKATGSTDPTIKPPTSWLETPREPLPSATDLTLVAKHTADDFPEEVRPHALDPNRQLNQYILVKVLGKGGMGEVWKAWDRKLSRWAAIKFLLGESAEGVLRFKREAKMAARLSHPNIAPVHEVGEAPSRQPGQPSCHFLAMEYIDGTTLGSAKLSLRDKVDVFAKVAQGLEAAHKGGIVHRDIKPANVMLTKENWPYVMDFGLAKSLDGDNNLSATGAVMGTPAFMPPEQVEGKLEEIGPWSDVYSLGATMYSVLCGSHPFTAQTTLQLLQKVCNEPPPSPRQKNPEISPELEAIVLKAMAKKKEDRYATAGTLADVLRKHLARLDAGILDLAAAPPPPPVTARSKPVWPILVGLLIFLGGATGLAAVAYKMWSAPSAVAQTPEPKADPKPAEEIVKKPEPKPAPVVKVDPKPEVKVEPKVEPKAEPNPEPKVEPKVEPKIDPKPEVKPEVKVEPKVEPKPEAKPEVKPVPLTPEQVIQRGIDYLLGRYRQAEMSSDADYWAAYALIRTPAAKEKVAEFLRSTAWQQSAHGTTVAALRALALAGSGDPALRTLTAECAQYLVETQGANGLWADATEAEVKLDEPKAGDASPFIVSGDPAPRRIAIAKKGTAKKAPDGDLATTSLALLGLTAAESCGHRVSGSAWKAALDGVESKWTPDGAWGDDTAAGLVSVALCRFATGEADGSKNEKVQIGVRRLAAHYAPEKEPRTLNGVERVGGLLSTPRLGEQEWYTPGAKALAAAQQPDGSWVEEGDPVLGTSRALLFLTRSTAALKAVTKRGGAGRLELKSIGGCTNLMFVLDASGYMRQDLDNKERFEVAKETIAKIVDKLPEGAVVGLRAFGHRKGANEPGCETDSQLVTAPGPVNKRQMVTHMESIQVKGWSPLTFSLIETVKDLSRVPPDVPMAVVLLVDGLDTDRKANPIPAAGDLAGSRPGLKVHVVGFNTDDDEIRVRLRKMADAGGGVFIPARTSKDILPKLMTATIGEQDFTLLNEKGETVVKGRMGDTKELPEGVYTLVVGKFKEQIWVNPGQVTRIIVNQEKLAGK